VHLASESDAELNNILLKCGREIKTGNPSDELSFDVESRVDVEGSGMLCRTDDIHGGVEREEQGALKTADLIHKYIRCLHGCAYVRAGIDYAIKVDAVALSYLKLGGICCFDL
jgi:hypothetical protein